MKKFTFKIEFTETCDTLEHAKDLVHDTISTGIKYNEIDSWLEFVSEEEVGE